MIHLVRESESNNQRFCFILGSGASVESGIPTGNNLEMEWMDYLMGETADSEHRRLNPEETRKLAEHLYEEEELSHKFSEIETSWRIAKQEGQSLSSKFYFDIYKLRFHPNPRNGYRYLERIMEKTEPSPGYHTMALMLTKTNQHNLVITTNFDSLIEDSLFLYTDCKPLIVSHESLAAFIDSDIHRPIIAKVHRGLMYDPFNSPETTGSLKNEWRSALDYALKTYTPIVIGYGGGDGSLMSFLREASFEKGIYWCYRESSGLPERSIQQFVKKKKGCFVSIDSFDAFFTEMGWMLFGDDVTPSKTRTYWEQNAKRRISRYTQHWHKMTNDPKMHEILKPIIQAEQKAQEQRAENGQLTAWDHFDRGFAAAEAGDLQEAIQEYTEAISLDPNYAYAYNNRGNRYADLGQYEEAIADLNTAIKLDPHDAAGYYNRGSCYYDSGQFLLALRDYTTASVLDPKDASTLNNRGSSLCMLGEYQQAIIDFTEAIALNPEYASAYNNRAFAHAKTGNPKAAIEDAKIALSLSPDSAAALHTYGYALMQQEQYSSAIEFFGKAIASEPCICEIYMDRAQAYRALGETALAEADEAKVAMLEAEEKKNNS